LLNPAYFLWLKQPLERTANMARGEKPDFIAKFPVNGVWHRLGAGWHNGEKGSINVVLDVGVALTFPPGAKLVLVPPLPEDEEK
jgi:hypothetical protein